MQEDGGYRYVLPDSALYDVRAFSESDVWVSGEDGPVWRWDGENWSQQTMPQPMGSLWGSTTSDIWAMRRWSLHHFNGQEWRQAEVP